MAAWSIELSFTHLAVNMLIKTPFQLIYTFLNCENDKALVILVFACILDAQEFYSKDSDRDSVFQRCHNTVSSFSDLQNW